jgi:RND family efflux transporter MFP subunit
MIPAPEEGTMAHGSQMLARGSPLAAPCPTRWRRCALLVLVVSWTATSACRQQNTFAPPPPPKVTISQPVERSVTEYMEFTGNTAAINTVQLRARVEGNLEQVLFQDGDRVVENQLLFVIEREAHEASLKQAQGRLRASQATYALAQIELSKFAQAAKTDAVSEIDLQRSRHRRDQLEAQMLTAEAEVELAQLDLGYTEVRAPFDGRIDRRLKDIGNLVGVGEETILAEINQVDPIYVYFTMSERDLLRIKAIARETSEGAATHKRPVAMRLATDDGFPHEGHIDFASISLDPATGTLLLRAVFPNPDLAILPGLFAQIRAAVGRREAALLIPQAAVGGDQLGDFVLVVGDGNVVERRAVTVGSPVDGGMRVVEKGLDGTERVIVKGLLQAIPGREVQFVLEQAATGEPVSPGEPHT